MYLDLVRNCYSSRCIEALTRSYCNPGVPKLILSDNWGQLVSSETQNLKAKKGITWKFNLAAASWWGGFFGRLVRFFKKCLKKILKNLRFNYEQLLTLLAHTQPSRHRNVSKTLPQR